jgi:hypothetical protein
MISAGASSEQVYVTNAGKDTHVRVKKVGPPEVTKIRTWGAHEQDGMRRHGPTEWSDKDPAAAGDFLEAARAVLDGRDASANRHPGPLHPLVSEPSCCHEHLAPAAQPASVMQGD